MPEWGLVNMISGSGKGLLISVEVICNDMDPKIDTRKKNACYTDSVVCI